MLSLLTIIVMLVVAYVYWREGLLTACCMCVNVFLAGLITFNFFEPLAGELEGMFRGSFLAGYEDAVCMTLLFAGTLGALRWVTNNLANTDLDYPALVLRAGNVFFGVLTGYLVSGFLVCMLQTLPWQENFMGFEPKVARKGEGDGSRRLLPPDRVWLALMHRAGAKPLSRSPDPDNPEAPPPTFDPHGTFELRYARFRRYADDRNPLPDQGECPAK
jgi:hypothetical protein